MEELYLITDPAGHLGKTLMSQLLSCDKAVRGFNLTKSRPMPAGGDTSKMMSTTKMVSSHNQQGRCTHRGDGSQLDYVEDVTFTRDSWCDRMRACRGVGASLPPELVEQYDK